MSTQREFAPKQRITGTDRERFAVQLAEQYSSGMSVREIAKLHGRSYGNIHHVLTESGVVLRRRSKFPQ